MVWERGFPDKQSVTYWGRTWWWNPLQTTYFHFSLLCVLYPWAYWLNNTCIAAISAQVWNTVCGDRHCKGRRAPHLNSHHERGESHRFPQSGNTKYLWSSQALRHHYEKHGERMTYSVHQARLGVYIGCLLNLCNLDRRRSHWGWSPAAGRRFLLLVKHFDDQAGHNDMSMTNNSHHFVCYLPLGKVALSWTMPGSSHFGF